MNLDEENIRILSTNRERIDDDEIIHQDCYIFTLAPRSRDSTVDTGSTN